MHANSTTIVIYQNDVHYYNHLLYLSFISSWGERLNCYRTNASRKRLSQNEKIFLGLQKLALFCLMLNLTQVDERMAILHSKYFIKNDID